MLMLCVFMPLSTILQLNRTSPNTQYRGGSSGGRTRRAPPPKIGKNKIFWRKIVIFHTKYPKNFAPPSAIEKNMIFWRESGIKTHNISIRNVLGYQQCNQ
jgi:hypothetical protein